VRTEAIHKSSWLSLEVSQFLQVDEISNPAREIHLRLDFYLSWSLQLHPLHAQCTGTDGHGNDPHNARQSLSGQITSYKVALYSDAEICTFFRCVFRHTYAACHIFPVPVHTSSNFAAAKLLSLVLEL